MGSVGTTRLVDYDKWGPDVHEQLSRIGADGIREVYGLIDDRTVFETEHQLTPIEKKDAIKYALEFYSKEDGGWIIDDDYKIYAAYDDGTFRDVTDDPTKPLRRKGLIGLSISTPDDEMSWGGNIGPRGQFQQWGVHDENMNEVEGNYHAWYKTTGSYKVRTKTEYVRDERGRYRPKYTRIRQSTVKKWS